MARVLLRESVSVPVLQRLVKYRPLTVSDSQPPQAPVGLSISLQSIEHFVGSLRPDRLVCRSAQVKERLVVIGPTVDRERCPLIREPIVGGELPLRSLESPVYREHLRPGGDLYLRREIAVSLVHDRL
jgi:hypothetical protein